MGCAASVDRTPLQSQSPKQASSPKSPGPRASKTSEFGGDAMRTVTFGEVAEYNYEAAPSEPDDDSFWEQPVSSAQSSVATDLAADLGVPTRRIQRALTTTSLQDTLRKPAAIDQLRALGGWSAENILTTSVPKPILKNSQPLTHFRGYLQWKAGLVARWKQRWCVLQGDYFCIYTEAQDEVGQLWRISGGWVRVEQLKWSDDHTFSIHFQSDKGREVQEEFCVQSLQLLVGWMKAFRTQGLELRQEGEYKRIKDHDQFLEAVAYAKETSLESDVTEPGQPKVQVAVAGT